MEKIFLIAFITAGIIWVFGCFIEGRKKTLSKEKICTETIMAKILNKKEYHFFFKKYYSLNLNYNYNNQEYNINKGWFKKWDNQNEIPLHINPSNPTECYLLTLKEKCSFSNK